MVFALILPILGLFFSGCVTDPVIEKDDSELLPKSQSVYTNHVPQENQYNDIDMFSLANELNMSGNTKKLGYEEKIFNTCQIKSNRSPRPYCENLYFSQLHFHLMCRDSTGTVETVRLTPLSSNKLRWKSHGHRGLTQTNSQGFGKLDFVSKNSALRDHLYFYIGNKIARKSFNDYWKLILPQAWCGEH